MLGHGLQHEKKNVFKLCVTKKAFILILPCVKALPREWWLSQQAGHRCWSQLPQGPAKAKKTEQISPIAP